MGVVISSLYQLGAAAALHILADKGDGSPAVSEPSERSGATSEEARGVATEARRVRNRKRREKRRRGRRRKRWARSLVGRLSAPVRSVGSGLRRWALNCRRWRARYIISQKTDKEDRELKDRSNTSRRIVNKIDLDMGGARACRCNPGMDSVSGVCAAWWNARYPLTRPSFWGAQKSRGPRAPALGQRT